MISDYQAVFNKAIYAAENNSWIEKLNITDQDLQYIIMMNNNTSLSNSNKQTDKNSCYCNGTMRDIVAKYKNVHGYVSLLVCIFGTLANSINIAVLTRKQMKSAPFSYILTWLAITDMVLMTEYIPFALYMYINSNTEIARFSYTIAIYTLIHTNLSQVLHTMSICLTLTLAFWRYNAIRYPEKCNVLWTKEKCAVAVKTSMLLPVLICLPSYFMFSVQSTQFYDEEGKYFFLYYTDLSELAKSNNQLLYIVNLWLYAVVIKLLPCVILIVISIALIRALRNSTKRKQKLQTDTTDQSDRKRKLRKTRKRADRSSHMLIAILFLFLITELPQCILGLLSGIFGQCFFKNCYHLFGEIMDILALFNGAINFILYCTMSKQFRQTFTELFH